MTPHRSRMKWTPELLQTLRELLAQGFTHPQIAEAMGLRKEQVAAAVSHRGLGGRGSQRLTKASFREVLNAVCAIRGVDPELVAGRRRYPVLVFARQHVMWSLRQKDYSWAQIASAWGMDHTTIIWGVRRHEERLRAEAADDLKTWDRVGVVERVAA